jgi:hypothetical protein
MGFLLEIGILITYGILIRNCGILITYGDSY